MAKDNIPLSEQELLFDPMFAKNPEDMLKDGVKIRKGKKVFHKAILA